MHSLRKGGAMIRIVRDASIHRFAGKRVPTAALVDGPRLVAACYAVAIAVSLFALLVVFGVQLARQRS
jgi:hypothetical protein